jgi:hypothetical protein
MKMKIQYLFLLLVSSFLMILTSCTEKIDIKLDDTYTRVVLEGALSSDTTQHVFHLTKTASYYSNEPAQNIEGANITITDNLGNAQSLSENIPGYYSTPDNYYGVTERDYTIDIELADELGGYRNYRATSNLPNVAPIDSIGVEFNAKFGKDGYWVIKLFATDPAGIENYYMFNVYKNGILMTDTLDKVRFTDDKLFDGNYTNGIGVAFFSNSYEGNHFDVGDTVMLKMSGITKEQYSYLDEIRQSTGFQNPLFGGPPANVSGNLTNGGIGYFAAYSNSYCTLILTEDNISYVDF